MSNWITDFRVWDKYLEQWWNSEVYEGNPSDLLLDPNSHNLLFMTRKGSIRGQESIYSMHLDQCSCRFKLQQYTNLHDMNNIKIFEGDIVEFAHHKIVTHADKISLPFVETSKTPVGYTYYQVKLGKFNNDHVSGIGFYLEAIFEYFELDKTEKRFQPNEQLISLGHPSIGIDGSNLEVIGNNHEGIIL